jgi:hypothetical protein
MIIDFLLFALAAYFVYKVVFELIIPVFRTTQHVRRQFDNIHQQMRDQTNGNTTQNQNGHTNPPNRPKSDQNKSSRAGDYIDFEEVK